MTKNVTPKELRLCEQIQESLRKKLEYCNGLTGKRKEGFEEGIKSAMSIIHSVYKQYLQ